MLHSHIPSVLAEGTHRHHVGVQLWKGAFLTPKLSFIHIDVILK